jgi:hypothetical protein
MRENSRLANNHLDSQEGLCSLELVSIGQLTTEELNKEIQWDGIL